MSEIQGTEVNASGGNAPDSGGTHKTDELTDGQRPNTPDFHDKSQPADKTPPPEAGETGPARPATEAPANHGSQHTDAGTELDANTSATTPEPGQNGPAAPKEADNQQEEPAAPRGAEPAQADTASPNDTATKADTDKADNAPPEPGENDPAEPASDQNAQGTLASERQENRRPAGDGEPTDGREPGLETAPEVTEDRTAEEIQDLGQDAGEGGNQEDADSGESKDAEITDSRDKSDDPTTKPEEPDGLDQPEKPEEPEDGDVARPERLDRVEDAEQIDSLAAEMRARELAHPDQNHTVVEHINPTTKQLDRRVLTGENARGEVQRRAPANATKWQSDASAVIASDYLGRTQERAVAQQEAEARGANSFAVRQPLRDALGPNWRNEVYGRTIAGDGMSTEASNWHEDSQAVGVWRKQQSDDQWHLYSCYPEPNPPPGR